MGVIPIKLLGILDKLHSAFNDGNSKEIREIIRLLLKHLPLLQPDDQIYHLASAGKSAMFHKRWEEAAALFELLCPLAFTYEPDSNETAGDFRNLGICFLQLKQHRKAYSAFKKAREILIIGVAPKAHIEDIDKLLEFSLSGK